MRILSTDSQLYQTLNRLAQTKRMIFMAGLPGVGKSLLLQQLLYMATEAKRKVHTLQWDVSREAFETPEILAKYPEIEGVTDPIIRKAVGAWSRQAVVEWDQINSGDEHLLVSEVPLMGNRLSELVQPQADECEPLLSSRKSEFVVPVPSKAVRSVIEQARERTINNPQHEKEEKDAPPPVLRAMWQEVNALARQIGLAQTEPDAPYDPAIYGGVYAHLLQHRHHQLLPIGEVLQSQGSVYQSAVETQVLAASPSGAKRIIENLEKTTTQAELADLVERWYELE